MKSRSFILVLIIFIVASTFSNSSAQRSPNINNNNNNNSNDEHKIKCYSEWLRLVPCVPQLIDFSLGWSRNQKINPKCCDIVVDLFDTCHDQSMYRQNWFVRANKSCSVKEGNDKLCQLGTTSSCFEEFNRFEKRAAKQISATCCSDLVEIRDKDCFWVKRYRKSHDYCSNHH